MDAMGIVTLERYLGSTTILSFGDWIPRDGMMDFCFPNLEVFTSQSGHQKTTAPKKDTKLAQCVGGSLQLP